MSIIYSLDPSKATAFAIWDGVITAEEWLQSVTAFLAEPELRTIRRVIVDAEAVTDDSSITNSDIEKITGIFAGTTRIMSHAKYAVIARNPARSASAAERALVRLGIPVVTFNFLGTACVYLDIPLEETQRTLDELRAKLLSRGNQ